MAPAGNDGESLVRMDWKRWMRLLILKAKSDIMWKLKLQMSLIHGIRTVGECKSRMIGVINGKVNCSCSDDGGRTFQGLTRDTRFTWIKTGKCNSTKRNRNNDERKINEKGFQEYTGTRLFEFSREQSDGDHNWEADWKSIYWLLLKLFQRCTRDAKCGWICSNGRDSRLEKRNQWCWENW